MRGTCFIYGLIRYWSSNHKFWKLFSDFFLHCFCSGKCECTLFGSYVDTLQEMLGKSASGLPVVIV